MRFLLRCFIPALLAIVCALPALAETKVVGANRSTPILYWFTYLPDTCAYGSKPTPRISLKPEHGSLSFKWQAMKMHEDTRGCKGKSVKGMLVIYTPEKGYHGKDSVAFSLSGSGVYPGAGYSLGRSFNYDITVK